MSNYTVDQAARAFNRLMQRIDLGYEVAYAAAAGYDAGEFSGPVLGEQYEADELRVLRLVSGRMGLSVREVETEVVRRQHDEPYVAFMQAVAKQERANAQHH